MSNFKNKIVVITGGNSGIGLSAAVQFKNQGAIVVTNARNEERKTETLREFPDLFDQVITADLSDLEQTRHFITAAGDHYKQIDVLYLNAGIARFSPLDQIDESHYDEQFNLNVKSLLFSVKYALPYLRHGSSVLLTSSIVNQIGMLNSSVYAASKAAVKSIAQTLAAELVERGIRVNAISPGPIETPIFSKMDLSEEQLKATAEGILSQIPLKRFGTSAEVASLVLQVAGNGFINGQELVIDGGMAAK
ncbi:SDR family oxidoreductase [Fulvivirga sedimenti]|uniref:SDR family oxidoreductase n=1 Tax=Fulvivirga sedimenti TaxID=2879465 RepID=A0A9X1L017_9BACT|nr:SDR family oxidoreductase [Fulvivirga sedimenti]MCA6078965.1 SDR family oxidoreductase [Fulvivirga sedimenti]